MMKGEEERRRGGGEEEGKIYVPHSGLRSHLDWQPASTVQMPLTLSSAGRGNCQRVAMSAVQAGMKLWDIGSLDRVTPCDWPRLRSGRAQYQAWAQLHWDRSPVCPSVRMGHLMMGAIEGHY
jgi:hypothetical protein